jgi:hypothetical protein
MSTHIFNPDKPSSRLYDIPKLLNDGSNYTLWKFRIGQVLEARGLTEYIQGKVAKPDASNAQALATWTAKDRDARLQVTLTLEDEPLLGVISLTEAKPIWDALSTRYDGKGLQSVAYLMTKVFRSHMTDTSGDSLDSQAVISTILAEEQRRRETSVEKALKARTRKPGKSNKSKDNRPTCGN